MTYSNPVAYESFMGRWSTRLAPQFIAFVGVKDGQHILDVGCGTGSLSRALLASSEKIRILGVDPLAAYVSFAQNEIAGPRIQFRVAGAEALPFDNGTFDAALSLLVLQDIADPNRAISEMGRVTRPGGSVAACQWDFQDGLPMLSLFWQAAEAVAPDAVARHRAGNLQRPHRRASLEELAELWLDSGLAEVRTTILELSMEFSSFDDFWLPFLGGSTPTSRFAASTNRESEGTLASVLCAKLPDVQPDGSFVLPARAWAVAGIAGR
jgi:ubiquinone/menaquinone biosynthesis C-methylase UbiE